MFHRTGYKLSQRGFLVLSPNLDACGVNNAANSPRDADVPASSHCWTGPRARRVDLIDLTEDPARVCSFGSARSLFGRRPIAATGVFVVSAHFAAGLDPSAILAAKAQAGRKAGPKQLVPCQNSGSFDVGPAQLARMAGLAHFAAQQQTDVSWRNTARRRRHKVLP